MIDLVSLRFHYEDMRMEFTLHVPEGALLAVIGPSGGGKSTLLSLIAGFETPLSGSLRIGGVDMMGVTPANRPVSMIFQDHNVFAHLDLRTNVALGISHQSQRGGESCQHQHQQRPSGCHRPERQSRYGDH